MSQWMSKLKCKSGGINQGLSKFWWLSANLAKPACDWAPRRETLELVIGFVIGLTMVINVKFSWAQKVKALKMGRQVIKKNNACVPCHVRGTHKMFLRAALRNKSTLVQYSYNLVKLVWLNHLFWRELAIIVCHFTLIHVIYLKLLNSEQALQFKLISNLQTSAFCSQ